MSFTAPLTAPPPAAAGSAPRGSSSPPPPLLLAAGVAAAPVVGTLGSLGVRWGVWEEAGTLHAMEDVWAVEHPLGARADVALCCVFDGHCGPHAALQVPSPQGQGRAEVHP